MAVGEANGKSSKFTIKQQSATQTDCVVALCFKGSIDGIECSLSQNWPKQVFEVHLNCLMDSTNHYNTSCTIPKTYDKL